MNLIVGWIGVMHILAVTCLSVADDGRNDETMSTGVDSDDTPTDDQIASSDDSVPPSGTNQGALQMYRRLLRHKRVAHLEAVKKIIGLNSMDKQHKMLQAIFPKLFMILVEARVKLTEQSFVPTDPFPTDGITADAFSTILENTAFLGDIVLRLPDVSHALLESNGDWKSMTQWAVEFTNDSKVFVDKDYQVISLMAQELELIEKEPNFINPYKQETKVEKIVDEELRKILAEQRRRQLKKEKQEQRKRQKGPRMSSARTEL